MAVVQAQDMAKSDQTGQQCLPSGPTKVTIEGRNINLSWFSSMQRPGMWQRGGKQQMDPSGQDSGMGGSLDGTRGILDLSKDVHIIQISDTGAGSAVSDQKDGATDQSGAAKDQGTIGDAAKEQGEAAKDKAQDVAGKAGEDQGITSPSDGAKDGATDQGDAAKDQGEAGDASKDGGTSDSGTTGGGAHDQSDAAKDQGTADEASKHDGAAHDQSGAAKDQGTIGDAAKEQGDAAKDGAQDGAGKGKDQGITSPSDAKDSGTQGQDGATGGHQATDQNNAGNGATDQKKTDQKDGSSSDAKVILVADDASGAKGSDSGMSGDGSTRDGDAAENNQGYDESASMKDRGTDEMDQGNGGSQMDGSGEHKNADVNRVAADENIYSSPGQDGATQGQQDMSGQSGAATGQTQNALKVMRVLDENGKEIQGMSGWVLYYLETDKSKPLITSHQGQWVTVKGTLYPNQRTIMVDSFQPSPQIAQHNMMQVTLEGKNLSLCQALQKEGASGCDRSQDVVLQVTKVISAGTGAGMKEGGAGAGTTDMTGWVLHYLKNDQIQQLQSHKGHTVQVTGTVFPQSRLIIVNSIKHISGPEGTSGGQTSP